MSDRDPKAATTVVSCGYCKTAMITVVLGWQCPACHATAGQAKPVSR
jgi:hypothetical protein